MLRVVLLFLLIWQNLAAGYDLTFTLFVLRSSTPMKLCDPQQDQILI